jgi:hypothetical protein
LVLTFFLALAQRKRRSIPSNAPALGEIEFADFEFRQAKSKWQLGII